MPEINSKAEERRRYNQFQVRLPPDVAEKVRHFMKARDYNQSQALTIIISKFFN